MRRLARSTEVFWIYMSLMCSLLMLIIAPGYLILFWLLIFVTRNRSCGINEDWLRTSMNIISGSCLLRDDYSFKSENNGCSILMNNIFYGHAPLKSGLCFFLSGCVLHSVCALIPSCSDLTSNGQVSVLQCHPWIRNADTHSRGLITEFNLSLITSNVSRERLLQ